MLTEEDISRVLEETVEANWYGIKEDRVYWTSSLCRAANHRGYTYEELFKVMDDACEELSRKAGTTFKPYLSAFRAYIRDGKINEKGGQAAYQEYFESLPDCDMCFRGEVHAYLWNDNFTYAELRYHSCSCDKGRAMQRPIYMGTWEDLKAMEKEYGERYEYGPTKPVTPEEIALLKAKINEKMADNFDPDLNSYIPF